MNEIKLIVFDMDGTLLNEKSQISELTRTTLINIQSRNIPIVFASGRAIGSIKAKTSFLEKYWLAQNGYITLNGQITYDSKAEVVTEEPSLAYHDARRICFQAQDLGLTSFIILNDEEIVAINSNNQAASRFIKYSVRDVAIYPSFDAIDPNVIVNIVKVILIQDDHYMDDVIGDLKERLDDFELMMVAKGFLEINHKGITKGKALQDLVATMKLTADNVLVFGDGENDISMFEFAKYGIAMKNSLGSLKERAFDVCDSNDNDGVAKYLIETFDLV